MSARGGVRADLADVAHELRCAAAKVEEARNVDLATLDGRGAKALALGHAECAIRRALYLLDEARA